MKIHLKTNERNEVFSAERKWKSRGQCASLLSHEESSISVCDWRRDIFLYRLSNLESWTSADSIEMFYFHAVKCGLESARLPRSGGTVDSSPGLFYFTPKTLENGGELLKYTFIFSIIRWLSTLLFFSLRDHPVVITACELIFLVLWTYFYSK